MKILDDTRIGTKLVGSFMFISVVIAAMGFVATGMLQGVMDKQDTMYLDYAVPLGALGEMTEGSQRTRAILGEALVTGETGRMGGLAEIEASIGQQQAVLDEIKFEGELKAAFRRAKSDLGAFLPVAAQVATLARSGQKEAAQALFLGQAVEKGAAASRSLDEVQGLLVAAAKELDDTSDAASKDNKRVLVIFVVATTMLALLCGVVLTRSITRPLLAGVAMMKEMAKGHLGTRLNMDRKDEIGVLAAAMDGFADDLQGVVRGQQQVSARLRRPRHDG